MTSPLELTALREIRAMLQSTDARLDAISTMLAEHGEKVDRLSAEIADLDGRVRRMERRIEAMADVIGDGDE